MYALDESTLKIDDLLELRDAWMAVAVDSEFNAITPVAMTRCLAQHILQAKWAIDPATVSEADWAAAWEGKLVTTATQHNMNMFQDAIGRVESALAGSRPTTMQSMYSQGTRTQGLAGVQLRAESRPFTAGYPSTDSTAPSASPESKLAPHAGVMGKLTKGTALWPGGKTPRSLKFAQTSQAFNRSWMYDNPAPRINIPLVVTQSVNIAKAIVANLSRAPSAYLSIKVWTARYCCPSFAV